MYKLLIADDERVEREAIQFFIGKAGLKFLRIEEASNGIQAVEKAKDLLPEIIIMDIKMPGKNGLEAAREIRRFKPDCRIIFLTAFNEFDYAHQAIKVKAEDFIIKPAYGEDLIEILCKVITDLDHRKASMAGMKDLENRVALFSRWLEDDLLMSMAKGYIEESRLNDYFARMDIRFNTAVCVIMNFRQKGMAASVVSNYSREYIYQRLKGIIETECSKNQLGHLLGCAFNTLYVMVMANIDLREDKHWSKNFFEHVRKSIGEHIDLEIRIGIGNIFGRPQEASNSFFQAKIACKSIKNPEGIMNFENMDKVKIDTPYPLEREKRLCEYIVKGDEIEAARDVEEIMDWISQFSVSVNWVREKVHELMTIIDRAVIKEFDVDTVLIQNRFDELNSLNSINEIIIFVKSIVTEIIIKINSLKYSPSAVLIDRVCHYIDQNYYRDIKLDEMCTMVGFSRYYFCRIFKQYKNMSFVDYITSRRILKAKGLLKDYQSSIKEISSEIGYNDPNYFTSVFKRWEGISPTEYRNKHTWDKHNQNKDTSAESE